MQVSGKEELHSLGGVVPFFCHQAITKEVHQDPEAHRTKRVALGGVATLPGQCTIPCLRESYASIFAVFQEASGYHKLLHVPAIMTITPV